MFFLFLLGNTTRCAKIRRNTLEYVSIRKYAQYAYLRISVFVLGENDNFYIFVSVT